MQHSLSGTYPAPKVQASSCQATVAAFAGTPCHRPACPHLSDPTVAASQESNSKQHHADPTTVRCQAIQGSCVGPQLSSSTNIGRSLNHHVPTETWCLLFGRPQDLNHSIACYRQRAQGVCKVQKKQKPHHFGWQNGKGRSRNQS